MTTLWPTLTVCDVKASLAFYSERLGFRPDLLEVDDAGVAYMGSVEVGGTVIMFETAGPSQALEANHGALSGVSLTVLLDDTTDIDALYARLQASEATICTAIGDRPWGNRDFGLRDPDGYQLIVARPLRNDGASTTASGGSRG